jgi:pyrophosphatase PpaX
MRLPDRRGTGPLPRIRTVLFDLDGTLIDSVSLILASCHHTMTAHGLAAKTDEEWLRHIGTPLTAHFAAWADELGTVDAMIKTYRAYNLEHHDRMVREYPGVVDAVRQVRGLGVATGLVTSKMSQGALRGLKLVGLDETMDVMVCADHVVNAKPHPEPVEKAVSSLGADPSATLYVGDSLHDLHSGRAAGVLTGAALWGPFDRSHLASGEPDFWLDDPGQIVALVRASTAPPDAR